jgi:DNA invertase Pin-like site-specific DNA recombinase
MTIVEMDRGEAGARKLLLLVDDRPGLFSVEQQQEIAFGSTGRESFEAVFLEADRICQSSALLAEAKKRAATHLVLPRLQVVRAITKDLQGLVRLIADLNSQGVQFCSVEEAISTEDGIGIFLKRLASGWEDAVEKYKHENPRVSQIRARARGTRLGRPKKRDDAVIRTLRSDGASFREIAFKAGVSVAAVQRSLRKSSWPGPKS